MAEKKVRQTDRMTNKQTDKRNKKTIAPDRVGDYNKQNREKRLKFYMIVKQIIFEDRVSKLDRKIGLIFKLKYSKFEQDPFSIKDFMAQNIISCLPEGYSRINKHALYHVKLGYCIHQNL